MEETPDTLSVSDQTPEEAAFTLGANESNPLVDPVLTRRSVKASIATGIPASEVSTKLASPDGEANIRNYVQQKDELQFHQDKIDMINEVSKSGPMDMQKADFILSLSKADLTNPDPNKLEQKYAENVLKLAYANADNPAYNHSMETNPDKTNTHLDGAEGILRTREVMQKTIEDSANYADHSAYGTASHYAGTAWNMLEQLVPGKSDWVKFDKYSSDWMPGDNMASQAENLWLLPPQEREAKFKAKFEEISQYNPLDAQDWARNMLSFSKMDVTWSKAMTTLDVASSLPFGLAGKAFKAGTVLEKGATEAGTKLVQEAAQVLPESVTKLGLIQAKSLEEGLTSKLKEKLFSRDNKDMILQRNQIREHISNLENKTEKGLKDAVEVLSTEKPNPITVLGRTGNVETAIDLGIREDLAKIANGDVRGEELLTLRDKLAGIYNPAAWLETSRNMTREGIDRTMSALANTRAKLNASVLKPGAALRLTEEQLSKGIAVAKSKLRDLYPNASDSVIDTRWKTLHQENTASQVNSVTMTLGDTNALPFVTPEDAIQAAEHLYMIPKEGYKIESLGSKSVIEVTRPVDETDRSLLSASIDTNSQTPKGLWNTLLGQFRSPEDLLSKNTRDNRNAIVPLAQETLRMFSDAIAPSMKKLSKEQNNRMKIMMKINRDFQEGDVRGRWFKDAAEYEQHYQDVFKSYPTQAETEAFMVAREVSDFDWAVKSLTIFRDESLQGLENINHKIKVSGGLPEAGGELTGFNFKEVQFKGKRLDALPVNDIKDNPGVIIMRDNEVSAEWSLLSDVNRTEIEKMLKEEGYRVYQSASPTSRPYKELGGDHDASIFILRDANTSPLKVNESIPYAAGGHVEYGQGFYTKTANMYHDKSGRKIYAGDTSLMYHVTEAQAKKYTAAFQQAREIYKTGDMERLKDFLRSSLPHTVEDFAKAVKNIDETSPTFYVKSGQTTKEAARTHLGEHNKHFDGVVDLSESKYNLSSFVERKFAQEKNLALPSVKEGSEGKPLFNYSPSQKIDPLSTMHRAMHSMVKNIVYDNYRKQAITSFIEEFANPETLGGSVTKRNLDNIRNNPISFLVDPLWNTDMLDKAKLAAAKNVHRSIVQLLGMPSEVSRNVDWISNKILDFTYNKFGDVAAEKVADFMHTTLRDPTKYARSIAFHAKLGLFNPVQLFLQGQGIVHAMAVTGNPARSYKAGAAASLMRMLSLAGNDEIVHSFAKKAAFFGWDEGEFKEAFTLMRDTGVWNVEGDYASLDDMFSQKIFKGKAGAFLDKGTMFFKEGERFVRLNAFNTAYLEWKQVNKGAKLIGNQRAINSVLTRYDDLALNMTSKSTASFQKGIFSLPTQFSTYTIHLAEQMLGKRLSKAERARALATYSVLYGLPAGLAAAVPLHPWGNDIKEAALAKGIGINDTTMDLLLNGVMSNALELATGKETNISERYGPSSLSFISDAMTGDKTAIELMFGPSGQVTGEMFKSIFKTAAPIVDAITSASPDSNDSYPLLFEDFVQRFRTVSSVDNAVKLFVAANHHKFMSKNNVIQSDADVYDGLLAGAFGLTPRSISDAYIKNKSMKSVKEFKIQKGYDVEKNVQRAIDNFEDVEAFNRFMRAAKLDSIDGGMTPSEFKSSILSALRNTRTTLVESINRKWIKEHPASLEGNK